MVTHTVSPPFLSLQLRTDAEKRSLVESGLSWYSEDGKASHKLDNCSYDSGSLKTEAPSKWRKKPPSLSEDFGVGVKGELKKPQSLGQPGSFKKGRNPPVGVTSPITHTSQSMLKVAGEMDFTFCLLLEFGVPSIFLQLVVTEIHFICYFVKEPCILNIEQQSQISAQCQDESVDVLLSVSQNVI